VPNTVEHKVEMFKLAQERRAAGLPSWDRKIRLGDIFRNESMTFEQRRDAIVARLRASAWLGSKDEFDNLVEAVDGLAHAEDAEEFDGWWDEIYDIADEERVWIETRR
jgi:hypothetical protein